MGATIFPIGLGSRVDKEFLEHLATVTGGDPYFSVDPGNLRNSSTGSSKTSASATF